MIAPYSNSSLSAVTEFFTLQTENNKKIILSWETASEIQNKQFVVQRSAAGSENFKDIGTVAANHSPSGSLYSFTDEPGLNGAYLYRLVQVNADGKKTYSGTRLAILKNNKYWQITDNESSWQIRTDQQIHYILFDMQGRLLENGSFNGTKFITKPAVSGVYLLRIECNGEVITQKLLK